MSGVPTSVHLGPLTFHLYGLGLAIATYLAYLYARRRLAGASIDVAPFGRYVAWLLAGGLVGARAAHLATNWSLYSAHPGQWLAVWNGGLASFGGLAVALPLGVWLERRWWPDVALLEFTDALVPAVVAGWAMGRVLGPQFMVAGGGHLTHQWFGLRYHGQVGRRVPVPLIQGLEDGLLWAILVTAERRRWLTRPGALSAAAMIVWGAARSLDERLLLGQESHSGSLGVQGAGVALALIGLGLAVALWRRRRAEAAASPTARDVRRPAGPPWQDEASD